MSRNEKQIWLKKIANTSHNGELEKSVYFSGLRCLLPDSIVKCAYLFCQGRMLCRQSGAADENNFDKNRVIQ